MNSNLTAWITAPGCESPWFYSAFHAKKGQNADIVICGLGYFELYCNGKKVSPDLLTPVWSNYESRDGRRSKYGFQPEMTTRVYYNEYDLTPYLTDGENAIGIWLGNGWYNQHERNIEGDYSYGHPKLSFCIKVTENGRLISQTVSDEKVLWRPSHIVFNNIYYGEKHDFTLYDSKWCLNGEKANWITASLTQAPQGNLQKQLCPPDRVIRTIEPVFIGNADGGKLYDCRENITGWAVLNSVESGEVRVRYAEDLDESGNPLYYSNASSNGSQMQEDTFVCTAAGQPLKPRFCWHGFRYLLVYGNAEIVSCEVVHSDIKVTSDFQSDHETLNWLYETYLRTQLGNFHGGVPSDCPHRERLGYTGDGQLTAETALLLTESEAFYRKWVQDILDCQDKKTGHVQHTAPYYGGGGGPGGWGCAIVQVPYALYRQTMDTEVLKNSIDPMLRWISYLKKHSEGNLITNEMTENGTIPEAEDCMCLGEWCTPAPLLLPDPFVNTYYYIKSLTQIIEILKILKRDGELPLMQQYLKESQEAFTERYFDSDTGDFLEGVQAANAFALDIGLGDERTKANLIRRYSAGRLDTGIFGTDVLLRKLFEYGEADIAVDLITGPEYPSFGYMKESGATTLWESWNGKASRNHPMFGACTRLLFQYLLGIRKNMDGSVLIAPVLSSKIHHLKGHITTADGKIGVSIRKEENGTAIEVTNETDRKIPFRCGDFCEETGRGRREFIIK